MHTSLKTFFFSIKPFLLHAKRSLTALSFIALAVLFSNLQNLGYVKQHNVAFTIAYHKVAYSMQCRVSRRIGTVLELGPLIPRIGTTLF